MNKPEFFVFPEIRSTAEGERIKEMIPLGEGNVSVENLRENVVSGLKLMEFLGVGGMSTRGFGRFKVLNLKEGQEVQS